MKNLLLFLFTFSFSILVAQQNCDELAKYRDNQLVSSYDQTMKEYKFNANEKAKYKKLKDEALAINFTTLNRTFGTTVLHLEAVCDIAKSMIGILPEGQLVSEGEQLAFTSADAIKKYFVEGKSSSDVIKEIAKDKAAAAISPAVEAANAMYDYYTKLKEINKYSEESKELIKNIQEQIRNFDNAIKQYEHNMSNQQDKLTQINEFKNAIDKYCGGLPVIEISTNLDCKFSIDMGDENILVKDDKKEIKAIKGDHVLIAKSSEKGLLFNTKFNVQENQPNPTQVKISFSSENDSIRICDSDNDCGNYKGEIIDGKANGKGIMRYDKGDIYEGYYKDDKKNGQGTYTWVSGNKYIGEWKDDKRDGQGTFIWTNGDKYIGEFKDSKFNGQGTITWSVGDKYVGEWKDNKRNGQGTYTYANGQYFIGEFLDDELYNGTAYNSDNSYLSTYRNGVVVN